MRLDSLSSPPLPSLSLSFNSLFLTLCYNYTDSLVAHTHTHTHTHTQSTENFAEVEPKWESITNALDPFNTKPSLDPGTQYMVPRPETSALDEVIGHIEEQLGELQVPQHTHTHTHSLSLSLALSFSHTHTHSSPLPRMHSQTSGFFLRD